MDYQSNSEQKTKEIAKNIAATLQGGEIILLSGELGAGKSTFTRGVAEFFKITDTITSPTFTLMNIYPIENEKIKKMVHIDTYRLEDEEKLYEIGAEDYVGASNTICLIEWPEKMDKLLENKKVIRVNIEHKDDGRKISIN